MERDEATERHRVYEAAVQDADAVVRDLGELAARFGVPGRCLGEDFAGTAQVAARWCERARRHSAVATELDAALEAHAWRHERLRYRVGDAVRQDESCDLIHVGNFSIGYLHGRNELLAYLRGARSRLPAGGFVALEIYGGASAWRSGRSVRSLGHGGGRIDYQWEQRHCDPLTGMVTDVLHFEVERADGTRRSLPESFTYRLRLWSPPELAEALREAGFRGVRFFDRRPPVEGVRELVCGEDLGEGFVLWVVGLVGGGPQRRAQR